MHRDIKPRNIFLNDKLEPKIADLGLALQLETPEGKRRRVGTPAYMSPEQAEGNVELDIRSDIHALGATIYHVLTGSLPFSGKDPAELLYNIRKRQPIADSASTCRIAGRSRAIGFLDVGKAS